MAQQDRQSPLRQAPHPAPRTAVPAIATTAATARRCDGRTAPRRRIAKSARQQRGQHEARHARGRDEPADRVRSQLREARKSGGQKRSESAHRSQHAETNGGPPASAASSSAAGLRQPARLHEEIDRIVHRLADQRDSEAQSNAMNGAETRVQRRRCRSPRRSPPAGGPGRAPAPSGTRQTAALPPAGRQRSTAARQRARSWRGQRPQRRPDRSSSIAAAWAALHAAIRARRSEGGADRVRERRSCASISEPAAAVCATRGRARRPGETQTPPPRAAAGVRANCSMICSISPVGSFGTSDLSMSPPATPIHRWCPAIAALQPRRGKALRASTWSLNR